MNEQDLGKMNPENIEAETLEQSLRKTAVEFGFQETPELSAVEKQAVADTEDTEKYAQAMVSLQELGEAITLQAPKDRFDLARVGLMLTRAATHFESDRLLYCADELYDALSELDNIVANTHPDVEPTVARIESFYQEVKKKLEAKERGQEPTITELIEGLRDVLSAEDLQDLSEMDFDEALDNAFTVMIENGIDDPEGYLIEKGILK